MIGASRWRGHRAHATRWAFTLHRLSGVALTLFLPVHFLVLSQAIEGAAQLDRTLRWTAEPAVKLAEVVLVLLLAAHMTGGVRLLALEFLPWREGQTTFVAVGGGIAAAIAMVFALNVFG